MAQFDPRSMIDAATGLAAARTAPHRLAEAAEMAAAEPVVAAISPIVLAGAVRMIEISLVALIGMLIYVAYVVPQDGLQWQYFAAIAGVSVLVLLAFQVADIYQVQAFRGHEKQYFRLASAWSVVFLILIGISFFAKAADQFSRVWLGSFYVIGLISLLAFRRALFILVRRWTREGSLFVASANRSDSREEIGFHTQRRGYRPIPAGPEPGIERALGYR